MLVADILKDLSLTQQELSDATGIPRDRIAKWVQGKGKPKTEDAKVLETFYANKMGSISHKIKPGDDNGGGNNEDVQVKEGQRKEIKALGKHIPLRLKPEEYAAAFGDWEGLPMYNVEVTASFVETYRDDRVFQPQYYLHDPRFRDCDFGAIITGDSMHSEIRHGDWVMCKEIVDKSFIVYGDIYYVVTTNGLETCKYVNADPEDRNNYLLVPRNQSISPSPIPKNMVYKIFRVRGILRGY